MNQIIMWIMAVGAVLGGVDRIAGNRFGLGKRLSACLAGSIKMKLNFKIS